MFCGIVAFKNSGLGQECLELLSSIKVIHIEAIADFNTIDNGCLDNLLFFITDELSKVDLLSQLVNNRKVPKFSIIFYNRSLLLTKETVWNRQDNFYFVVGEERQQNLKNLIRTLLNNHWRRIPYKQMDIDYQKLSPRMKRVMEYIETNDLHNCDIFHIANYLKITPGYFSQLFKSETGQTFRNFMQKVLNYYENLLFLDWKLDVKSVSRLLGYSEISSYSRSFKNRKGRSPRAFAKLNVHP